MIWEEALTEFTNFLKFERNFSDNTIDAYLRDLGKLKKFAESSLESATPDSITYEQLQEFLYRLSRDQSSERSQARWVSSAKAFFSYLLEDEFRKDNPATLLEGPKLGLYLPDTLSPEEVEKIIGANDLSTDLGQRNRCIAEMLYGCGLRVSELINLKISNINFKENFLKVEGKGEKVRFVPLADYTAELILNYMRDIRTHMKINLKCEDFLFLNSRGSCISRISVFLIIKDLTAKAGINKKISPHTFRHSYATHLLQNGADLRYIQEMLGHSSITTTEIYTHLETDELRDVILKHHPRNAQ